MLNGDLGALQKFTVDDPHTPCPPCAANNQVLKKYGPNRSLRWNAVQYLINLVAKPGTQLIRSQKNTV